MSDTSHPSTTRAVLDQINGLRYFMSAGQRRALAVLCMRSEEAAHFLEKIAALTSLVESMPRVYEQDGKGDDALAYLHYFHGGADWYITERDTTAEQLQAFGLVDLGMGDGPELGYVSLDDLTAQGVELDLFFTPTTLADIRCALRSKNHG